MRGWSWLSSTLNWRSDRQYAEAMTTPVTWSVMVNIIFSVLSLGDRVGWNSGLGRIILIWDRIQSMSRLASFCWTLPDQYSICGKTRGGSAMYFLTIFCNENLGVERHQRRVNPPPPTNRALYQTRRNVETTRDCIKQNNLTWHID